MKTKKKMESLKNLEYLNGWHFQKRQIFPGKSQNDDWANVSFMHFDKFENQQRNVLGKT